MSLRVAFVDHPFHSRTGSSQFFVDALESIAQVSVLWNDTDSAVLSFDLGCLDNEAFDLVFFWQIVPSPQQLRALKCQRIVLVPMFDSTGPTRMDDWVDYRGYYFVCFSRAQYLLLERLGLGCFYLQFYPDPYKFQFSANRQWNKVFFWERSEAVSPTMVREWFSSLKSVRFHHHFAPDPDALVSKPQGSTPDWEVSSWFPTKEEYLSRVAECGFFVAPRRYEGIGMSFLEAMASGMVVVGLDHPTLSEYIIHGKSGLLIGDHGKLEPPDLDWQAIGTEARSTVERGFQDYQVRLEQLMSLLSDMEDDWPRERLGVTYLAVLIRSRVVSLAGRVARGLGRRLNRLLGGLARWPR